MKKLLLIDGNSLLFRAYFATAFAGASSIMRTKDGIPTNAIYSLANIINKVLNEEKPDYALVAFDTGKPTFRHEKYQDYKGGRAPVPQELIDQFKPAREMLRKFGLFVYEQVGYEADDIIGTASLFVNDEVEGHIFSSDHDLLQLITDKCSVCLTQKGVSDLKVMTREALKEEMGIEPLQIIDLKGLMGDKSDNIPGVPGVGEKTAIKLLNEYNTLENILEADISGKLGEKIKENKDQAIMSKDLATINKEVPVEFNLNDLVYKGIDYNSLVEFFNKYEMYSLIKKLNNTSLPLGEEKKEVKTYSANYKIVSDIDSSVLNTECYLDLEINGDNYHTNEIVGLAIRINNENYFLKEEDLKNSVNVKTYLENEKFNKNCMDYKATYVALHRLGITLKGPYFDMLLSSYLLQPSLKEEPAIIFDYFSHNIPFRSDYYVKRTYEIEKIAEYGSLIVEGIEKVKEQVISKIKENDLEKLLNEIELPLAKILGNMEIEGILLNKELLLEKAREYNSIIFGLEKEIWNYAGEEFNINSPSQMAHILFDVLQLPANSKRSTSADELQSLSFFHPIIDKILEYRKYTKLVNTYIEGLPESVLDDGRIHTIYNQALTQTGRLSSREPNLQNITVRTEEGREVRKAFISKEGYSLLSFDYSQIELRVLASIANVKNLIDAYNNNEDIHTKTAMKVFNLPKEEIGRDERRKAKVVNFGIVYGMSEFGLASELGISFNEAKAFIAKYFEVYPEIKDYYENSINFCKENGYIKTLFNRKRFVPEINSSIYRERENAKRVITNTPIQGTAADIMKLSMIKVDKTIRENNLDCKILLQIHDEIVMEVKDEELEKASKLIKEAMEDFDFLKVKLVVEGASGKTWSK